MDLFPTLEGDSFGYLNLNECAKSWLARNHPDERDNPLLKPKECQRMIDYEHTRLGIKHSYGGWLEDRSTLWRGSYLDQEVGHIHLGVDFNVPVGTPVYTTHSCTIVRIDNDHPERFGWGPRIIVRLARIPLYLIYAHLDPGLWVRAGNELEVGTHLAYVGDSKHNGKWFPHLHVQAMTLDAYETHFDLLDGYGDPINVEYEAKMYPDPLPYVNRRRGFV